ncbi:T9SS type A sorting domain-containing protein, partial [Hymenobacter sp. UV11]
DFSRFAAQQSAPVTLTAGQKYYVEVLHKQGWGPGYVAVAWLRPDGVRQEPIPGSSLIPFVTGSGNLVTTISNAVVSMLPTAAESRALGSSDSLSTRNTLAVFPNPFSQQATVQFSVVKTGMVNLTLLNTEGQLVGKLYSGTVEAGTTQAAVVKADGLRNGLYVLRLVTPTGVLYQKVSCSSE